MKIRRFLEKDSRTAMARARSELGPDAVILSNKSVAGKVELVAAVDLDEADFDHTPPVAQTSAPTLIQPAAQPSATPSLQSSLQAAVQSPPPVHHSTHHLGDTISQGPNPLAGHSQPGHSHPARHSSEQPTIRASGQDTLPNTTQATPGVAVDALALADLQRELSRLRTMIEGRLSQLSWRDMAGMPSAKAAVQARLAGLGLSPAQAGSMVDILPAQGEVEDYWQLVLQMLVSRLRVHDNDALIERGGVVALMGPTGVGKTTAIAKLAARCVMRHGRQSVALISADGYRIGGQEQLQTFARYLGVPFAAATDAEELRNALDQLTPRPLVLIDTAGMSQRDARLYEQYRMLVTTGYDIETYLVMAATAQRQTLAQTVDAFGPNDLAGTIVTKVDEAASLGAVLDILLEGDLSVAYTSEGQQVPDDLNPAAAPQMVALAVELAAQDEAAGGVDFSGEAALHRAVV